MGSRASLRIIVAGYIVRFPLGGMTWHYLQYVLGLAQLGHDVYMIEDSDDYRDSCYDPHQDLMTSDPTVGLAYAEKVFDYVGLHDRWGYFDVHTNLWHGPLGSSARDICSSADVFINVSGTSPVRQWAEGIPVRAFVDTDPTFEQIRQLSVPERRQRGDAHTHFYSFGELIGSDGSTVPDDGRPWTPTRQPVVLDRWDPQRLRPGQRYTTVMAWDSYATREFDGIRYGMKSASFDPYMTLPADVDVDLEMALGSPTAPREALTEAGWLLRDPREASWDPWVYQDYLSGSRGEFSVAKHGYVVSRSGWFSERSAGYLASGRPVITQDTGFSEWLPTGQGVVAFTTRREAVEALRAVEDAYEDHASTARQIAEEYFAAGTVLNALLGAL